MARAIAEAIAAKGAAISLLDEAVPQILDEAVPQISGDILETEIAPKEKPER